MKSGMIMLAMVVWLTGAGYSFAEEKAEDTNTEVSETKETQEKAVTYCPVCGPEDEGHALTFSFKHNGKKYPFCSMECLKEFKKNPDKYLEATEAPEAE